MAKFLYRVGRSAYAHRWRFIAVWLLIVVAAATADARKAAEQFAKDSGTGVGGIKSATQGYFSVESRDGDSGGWGVSDTPYKKVRVVTTIDFYLQ